MLKDKVSNSKSFAATSMSQTIASKTNSNVTNAMEALVALGYSQTDAVKALAEFNHSLPVEDLIKFSLKKLSGRF